VGGDHDPKDDVGFFAADLGRTIKLDLTTAGAQNSDDECLPVGRYLLHADLPANRIAWVTVGAFVKGTPIGLLDDVPSMPMQNKTFVLFEFHVRKGVNDRIGGKMSGGTGTLYITKISFRL